MKGLLVLFLVWLVCAVVVSAAYATDYSTGYGTSGWSGFKFASLIRYSNNVSSSVGISTIINYVDNYTGTEYVNCTEANIYEGDGTLPFAQTQAITVAPGSTTRTYWFYPSGTFDKFGQAVYILTGATLTGNCGAFFGGWDIYFYPNGTISKRWTE